MIRLHHVPQSRSFRILWLLEELGLNFEVVEHSFFDKSLRGPEYLAISPAGRVPALEIDGRTLSESGAITQYLCETRGALQGARPERPDWLEWLHYAETIAVHVANLTQSHVVLREDWMRSPTLMRLEAARLRKTLEVVERGLSDEYILPSGFSAVDVAVSYGALIGSRFVSLEGLPRVRAWLARLAARPAFG
ncbi:MAG: glutathione S-transferase, partial [Rhodobacteraceae bacterium]|nr:glutathione S-transferase [Paracoccaceae bacterium]